MRSDELEEATRQTAFIGTAAQYPAYTQAIVLNELNDKLQSVFEDIVVKARSGYWLHEFVYTVASSARFRIPPRAVVGGLEKVEVSTAASGQPFSKLTEVPASVAQDYEQLTTGTPRVFTVQGDQVELIPQPVAGSVVRMTYYIRPSRLVPEQSNPNATQRGRITAVNVGARTVTVNALPFDQSLTVPVAITSALQTVDIVHPDGWHELSLVGASQTISGLVLTLGGTDSLSDVQVGDFVRVADQTDWPCLPDDFHRSLCDATAVKILLEMNVSDKATVLAASNNSELERFRSLLLPRVKSEPKQIPILARSRGRGIPGWRFNA